MRAVISRSPGRLPRKGRPVLGCLTALVVAGCGGTTSPSGGNDAGVTSDADSHDDVPGSADVESAPECDSSLVMCKSVPPPCPKGEVPVVSGACWAGYCVKPSTCASVKDCAVCNADVDVCAVDQVGPVLRRVHCVEVPPSCANDRSCGCLASQVCRGLVCAEFDGGSLGTIYGCSCPVC